MICKIPNALLDKQGDARKSLINILQEHPELPIIFNTYNEELAYDWSYTVRENFYCCVEHLYVTKDGEYTDDYDSLVEQYMDDYCDLPEYKNLSDDDFESECKKLVNELQNFEAIVITIN